MNVNKLYKANVAYCARQKGCTVTITESPSDDERFFEILAPEGYELGDGCTSWIVRWYLHAEESKNEAFQDAIERIQTISLAVFND